MNASTPTIQTKQTQVEMEWSLGSIPVADDIGKEIISRFDTSIHNVLSLPAAASNAGAVAPATVLYTDANGREFQKRVL